MTSLLYSKNYRKERRLDLKKAGLTDEIVTNEQGGSQSKLEMRMDLLPPRALLAESLVLAEGAVKHAPWNWLKIPIEDHLNHALVHITLHLAGNKDEDHLSHAACRIHFASELALREEETKQKFTEEIRRAQRDFKHQDSERRRLGVFK
jgi:hypothetical protein